MAEMEEGGWGVRREGGREGARGAGGGKDRRGGSRARGTPHGVGARGAFTTRGRDLATAPHSQAPLTQHAFSTPCVSAPSLSCTYPSACPHLRGLVLRHVEEAVDEVDDAIRDGAVHLLAVAERLRDGGGDDRVHAAGALRHDRHEAAQQQLQLGELLHQLHGVPITDGGAAGALAVRVEARALEARDALLEVEGVGAEEARELPALGRDRRSGS